MASKGEVGIDIDVARVPLREEDMEPFEIMVSESQERMLCVVEPSKLDPVLDVCRKWEVRATDIGEVTGSRRLRVRRSLPALSSDSTSVATPAGAPRHRHLHHTRCGASA